MQKIKSALSFFRLLLSHFRWKVVLIVLLGIAFSFLQGVSIVMIIPLLESFTNKGSSSFTRVFEWLNISPDLNEMLLLYFFILLLFAVFKALQILFTQRTITNFSNGFNVASIDTVLKADWQFFLKVPSSQLINLFKTEARSVKTLSHFVFQSLQNSIMIIIQLVFACFISLKLTGLLLLVLTLLFLLQRFVFKKNYSLGSGQVNLSESLQKYLSETFKSIKLLKLHRLEMKRSDEYKEQINNIQNNELKLASVNAWSDFVYTVSAALILVGIIFLSMQFHLLSMTALLVLLVLFSRVISQVDALVKTTGYIINLLPSYDRFMEVLALAKAAENTAPQKTEQKNISSFELKNIHFSFAEKQILKDISLKFEKGKFYVLTGPSGIGKTITSDLICGLITPQSGEILIDGTRKFSEELKNYQTSISYVLQDTVLFGMSLRDNISFFEKYSDEEVLDAAHKAGLKTLLDKLPEGLNALVKEDNRGFSGGEMQRIAIARALIRKTPFIILDEVTNALDRKNEDLILNTIQEIKKDSIVILITHKEYLFDLADEVVRL
jgi:ATP-binding cassette subfamily C protein